MKLLFLLSLLSACCRLSGLVSEKPEVVGSPVPIEAAVGEDVILPCHVKPPLKLFVMWKRNKTDVHTYRAKADNLDSQDKRFKNRTQLFHDEMDKGNISLKLFSVTRQDEGVYSCFVVIQHRLVKKGDVTLKIVPEEEDLERIVNPTTAEDATADGNNAPSAASSGISFGVIVIIAIVIGTGTGFVIGIVIRRQCGRQQEDPKYVASTGEDQNLQNETTSV